MSERNALAGVMALHRENTPEDGNCQGYTAGGYGYLDHWCVECSEQSGREYGTSWPCPTVRAVTAGLADGSTKDDPLVKQALAVGGMLAEASTLSNAEASQVAWSALSLAGLHRLQTVCPDPKQVAQRIEQAILLAAAGVSHDQVMVIVKMASRGTVTNEDIAGLARSGITSQINGASHE